MDKALLTVGRAVDNDIVVDDPAVSSRHCRVVREGSACYVEDLKSTNGTFLNAKRITLSPLRHDDAIGLGGDKHSLAFADERPQAAVPMDSPRKRGAIQVIAGIVDKTAL